MSRVEVRDLVIGEGIPKICVPIVEHTKEKILDAARSMAGEEFDLVEWRADWFGDALDMECNRQILSSLREIFADKPILYTFRTVAEGGMQEIDPGIYAMLLVEIARTGLVDLIDVEAYLGDENPQTKEVFEGNMLPADIIRRIHKDSDVKVIASNHDFEKTPSKENIVSRLCYMQDLGADLTKIAVMPRDRGDVLTLLAATEEMQRLHADRPFITMSMSGNGVISRLCGELFGSAVTFGAIGNTSAPGQLQIQELREILQVLHRSMTPALPTAAGSEDRKNSLPVKDQ